MRPFHFTRHQSGQSLVEMCVACIALVPLAIGLVFVGQYIHVRQTVKQAARAAAWDAAVSPSVYDDGALDTSKEQERLRSRYFGSANGTISAQAQAPTRFADPMLLDYSGQDLLTPENVTIAVYKNTTSPGAAGAIEKTIGKITGAFASAFSKIHINKHGAPFPPDSKGYVTARVDAKTTKAVRFKPLDHLELTFHAQTTLLADAWNADGGGEDANGHRDPGGAPLPGRTVRSQITYLAPSTALLGGEVDKIVEKIGGIIDLLPGFKNLFPSLGKFRPGKTAPDVVPPDKLQPYQP